MPSPRSSLVIPSSRLRTLKKEEQSKQPLRLQASNDRNLINCDDSRYQKSSPKRAMRWAMGQTHAAQPGRNASWDKGRLRSTQKLKEDGAPSKTFGFTASDSCRTRGASLSASAWSSISQPISGITPYQHVQKNASRPALYRNSAMRIIRP